MADVITMFLCGDVMPGRGIDQVLPHPSAPVLHEPYMKSATGYVALAEETSGPIPRPVSFAYVWGDALAELERMAPDVRIVNLETSITTSDSYWKDKSIHYWMNPANIPAITAAGIDCCVLANNHVLDWGYQGLAETLDVLHRAGVKSAGAGMNLTEAASPAVLEVGGKGRVLVFAVGSVTSGIPVGWAAAANRPGVNLLQDFSDRAVLAIAENVRRAKREGDVAVLSIHWGANWGYEIPMAQRNFARALIDVAGIDVVYGHSSHHVKAVEVYRGKPVLYGCGDFLNDYEGIGGCEAFRADLSLMYFPAVAPATGRLTGMQMTPTRIRHFRVNLAPESNAGWLMDMLNREGKSLGTDTLIEPAKDGRLTVRWS